MAAKAIPISSSGSSSTEPPTAARIAGEVGRRRGAVDEGEPVEQRRRAQRADDQVLEPRLQRVLAAQRRAAEHVERDREQLERDEERDQVLGLGDHRHPEHRAEQQRLELAVAAGARRAVDRLLAPGERDHERGRGDRDSSPRRSRGRRGAARRRPGSSRSPHCPISSPAAAASVAATPSAATTARRRADEPASSATRPASQRDDGESRRS